MTNFDEIFGEGELESLVSDFTKVDLFCEGITDDLKPPSKNEEGILNLRFKDQNGELVGSTSITYNKNNWSISLMNSVKGGLYEKVVQVLPEKAEELGVQTISCVVPNEGLKNHLMQEFKIEINPAIESNELIAPVDKLKEYGDWCKAGKPIEEQPDWKRSL